MVYSSPESDLDLNLDESFINNNDIDKFRVSNLYTSSSSFEEDFNQKDGTTRKKNTQSDLKQTLNQRITR